MKRNNNKGFTLAELLIVVAVIAVLVAVAIPTFTNQLEKSRQAVDISNLRGAYAAARLAEIDQAVGSETFKTVANNASDTTYGLQYWYDPDSGELTRVSAADATVTTANATGKARTQKVVADISQLPGNSIVYSGLVLRRGTPGTTDKRILVAFEKNPIKNDVYMIKVITFVTTIGTWDQPNQTVNNLAGVFTVTPSAEKVADTQGGTAITSTTFTFTTDGGLAPYSFGTPTAEDGVIGASAVTVTPDAENQNIVIAGTAPAYASGADANNTYHISVPVTDAEGNKGTFSVTLTVTE